MFSLGVPAGALAKDEAVREEATIEIVNINTADADTLQSRLVGIGKSKAVAIVAHREKYGKFYSAEELTAVRGIGLSTIEKNRERIVVR